MSRTRAWASPPIDEVISVADIECTPIDADDIVDSDKALDGVVDDPLTQEIDGDLDASTDDYRAQPVEDLIDPDFSPAAWGKDIE